MLTVLDLINLSTEYLVKKEIESPRVNAELLLAHTLKCKRLDLYLSYDRPLSEDEVSIYRGFIKRRSRSEPLQYIIGKVEFYGLEFLVNPSVLIPRPETEILVEAILNSVNKNDRIKILDIGVGSGNISVSLAKHLPNSEITATDLSLPAIETAKENAKLNNVLERINFTKQDINVESFSEEKFDIVVSNPPYISKEEFPNLKDELKVYEPKNALTDFLDGLNYFRIISKKSKSILNKNGKLYFEVGQGQAEDVKKILSENNFSDISFVKDYLKIDRVVSGINK